MIYYPWNVDKLFKRFHPTRFDSFQKFNHMMMHFDHIAFDLFLKFYCLILVQRLNHKFSKPPVLYLFLTTDKVQRKTNIQLSII